VTLVRLIAPEWLMQEQPTLPRVIENQLSDDEIKNYNFQGYNVYYIPNPPTTYQPGKFVEGPDIDTFSCVFVDCDLKDGVYKTKEDFLKKVISINIPFTKAVDSGNGVHVYWDVTGLDAMSYLRFQRRLTRLLNTDEAVGKIFQLMRLPGTMNTKKKGAPVPCVLEYESLTQYTAEELHKLLPPITQSDEQFCQRHYDSVYNPTKSPKIHDVLPAKFGKLLFENLEVKKLWADTSDDRSGSDYRLAHLMFANGFKKDEAATVLTNSAKALERAPVHRITYAQNIIDKIWTFETQDNSEKLELSNSVADILGKGPQTKRGQPFRCHPRIDNTAYGFRLGQVIGLVAGSGVGKTAFALNMFRWFAQQNPDYHHFFIPLEQPANEIAERWQTMCGADTALHSKIHVISNYDDDNNYRHLSLYEIQEYIKKFTRLTGNKVGSVVIDHIGVLKKKDKDGKPMELMDVCHSMKAFAVETNTMVIMQSQTSREKAGIGDLELNKDAAYGTTFFEAYCDYLVTLWQPLKRVHHEEGCPTVTAFKFCKIRHKHTKRDKIHEDVAYYLLFDPETEQLRDLTQLEVQAFNWRLQTATNLRKADRKTDLVTYHAVPYKEEDSVSKTSNTGNSIKH